MPLTKDQQKQVEQNMGLVPSTYKREFSRHSKNRENIIQAGYIGLMRAVQKFDPENGASFSTYAVHWIRCFMKREACSNRNVTVPEYARNRKSQVLRECQSEYFKTGRRVEPIEILERRYKEEWVGDLRASIEFFLSDNNETSLDAPRLDNDAKTLHNVIPDGGTSPEQTAINRERLQRVRDAIDRLKHNEKFVLTRRLGLEDGTCWELERIGKCLGFSRERARQVQESAMKKINQHTAEEIPHIGIREAI